MRLPAVYLGLGSYLGDREAALESGLARLATRGFRLTGRSSLWETEPVGGPPQGWFLNGVVRGETELAPEALLEACLGVERELGRERTTPCGPRTLDLDLLLYGELRRDTAELALPHPRLHQRRFVLAPLAELDPGLLHPVLGLTAQELLDRCPDTSRVVRRVASGVPA